MLIGGPLLALTVGRETGPGADGGDDAEDDIAEREVDDSAGPRPPGTS